MKTSKTLYINGLVQGIGFRPAIYRMAKMHDLNGTVENNNKGVLINVEGDEKNIKKFIDDIPIRTPVASNIASIKIANKDIFGYEDFQITKSTTLTNEITEVSPDIGVCDDCLKDIKEHPNRINYAFTNCTNCGPRFTIIKDLPYDRPNTTMDIFPMCDFCHSEYIDVLDRRFHAQPIACNNCGPTYILYYKGEIISDIATVISTSCKLIDDGKILAIKGLGGYHLSCDANNENSINNLRIAKSREGKPFAIMFKNIKSVQEHLYISKEEEELLTSWRKPIVLLKLKKSISPSLSIGLNTIGVMLPYMPFHSMLFERLKTKSIVLTSGNISDEPIIISNEEALSTLGSISDAVVTYNREIYNRTDDSVTKVINKIPRMIRRSRSYAPSPMLLSLQTEGIFAGGAELVNCFCIGKGNQAIMSQHIGDLKNLETLEFYEESVVRFSGLFRFKPQLAAMDMHPDYLSSRYVEQMHIPVTKVQHHHAHIASCMAEHKLDEKVIGVSFDGTGYGDDGNIWGGEFFICDLADYERITHLEYIMQPGGDAVTKDPWRMMTAYLFHYFGKEAISKYPFLFKEIDAFSLQTVQSMLAIKLNSPLSSSAGRLFDAISALLGVCQSAAYHAEAPMQLESATDTTIATSYSFSLKNNISFKSTFEEIISDLLNGIPIDKISGKFHNTMVNVIVDVAKHIRNSSGINNVVLSGGTFQNSILLEKTEIKLSENGFNYYTQAQIPSNDGGIALGQLAIAAKRRELGRIE
ncbi:MAG: carbamoyltransferase HypF [Bacteroidetes bacterium]|nr:carbamoyltransferase HypF [Bacteroidota bacterium]